MSEFVFYFSTYLSGILLYQNIRVVLVHHASENRNNSITGVYIVGVILIVIIRVL